MRKLILITSLIYSITCFSQCDYIEVNALSTTGEWGYEMAWELYGPEPNSTNLVANFQGGSDWSNSSELLCLEPGCYAVIMTDSWGDGWNNGSLTFELPEEDLDVEMTDGSIAYLTFEIENSSDACLWELPGCTDSEAVNYTVGSTMDDGSCVFLDTFLTSNKTEREYSLYIPNDLPENAPLVFVLHGYYGSGLSIRSYCGMNEVADEEGFAVCYPHGLLDFTGTPHWNSNLTGLSNIDDSSFLSELATYLQENYGFSSECTYSCGYSNGGYMSYTLACEHPDVFRAIGSVGGTMGLYDFQNCNPTNVPVVHIHGTNDDVVSYYATDEFDDYPWSGAEGVEDVVAMWAEANYCELTSEESLPNLDQTDGSTVDLIKHTEGDNGYEAWVYRVNNGGHDWFGAWGNMDILSSAEMWSFFSQFCNGTSEVDIPIQPELVVFSYNNTTIYGLDNTTINVFDQSGRIVLNSFLMRGNEINMSYVNTGLYTVVARGKEGVQSLRLFIP